MSKSLEFIKTLILSNDIPDIHARYVSNIY